MTLRSIVNALRRMTVGGSTSGDVSVSWTPPPSEREELRRLIVDLEDRRALFDPYNVEAVELVQQSVQQIRSQLTSALQSIDEDSRAAEPLRTMRDACQRYLTSAQRFSHGPPWRHPPRVYGDLDDDEGDDFVLALGELRGALIACVGQIASAYDIEVHGKLGSLVPRGGRR